MSFTKNISVSYQFLESTDISYFRKLDEKFTSILSSGNTSGAFADTKSDYLWKIDDEISLANSKAFIVSLAKEKEQLPAWFNDSGKITRIPKQNGKIGELFYAIICPTKQFIIAVAATSGSATGSFKTLLNEFSLDMGVRTVNLFENDVDKIVQNWGFYKKAVISLKFPLHDDLAEFLTTKVGSQFKFIDTLDGLSLDISIGSSKPKQVLNTYATRELIEDLIDNDFCTKLKISGGDFDDEVLETIDIKNAVIKYSEKVIINEDYLSLSDATSLILRAFSERANELRNKGGY